MCLFPFSPGVYELVTFQMKPGGPAVWGQSFRGAINAHIKTGYTKLIGVFHTEYGLLNRGTTFTSFQNKLGLRSLLTPDRIIGLIRWNFSYSMYLSWFLQWSRAVFPVRNSHDATSRLLVKTSLRPRQMSRLARSALWELSLRCAVVHFRGGQGSSGGQSGRTKQALLFECQNLTYFQAATEMHCGT